MIESIHQPPFGQSSEVDESATVDDDELMIDDARAETDPVARVRVAPRASQRVRRPGAPGVVRPGDVLAGKYLVERVLGRLGPEVIVAGRHLELQQSVRLRYLTPTASASPDAVSRFQRGARRARELRSERAERVIDFGRLESGCPYRVGEMPSGPSLDDILRVRGALSVEEAVDIAISACEPLAEAHAAGLVHRNLRTGSIFVERQADGSELVRVVDFGVSDALDSNAPRADGLGVADEDVGESSLSSISPERIRGATLDARADIWALGAILYELLMGVPVYEAESPLTLLAMIAADPPAPLNWLRPEIPAELEALVLSCLEKDPAARPRSVVELADALAPFGSADSSSAAGRVTRVALRSTRPPPLPSSAPSVSRSERSRAIVRSAVPKPLRTAKSASLPGWAMITGGMLVGVSLGLGSVLLASRFERAQPEVSNISPAAAAPAVTFSASAPPTETAVATTPPRPAPSPRPAVRPHVQSAKVAASEQAAGEEVDEPARGTNDSDPTPKTMAPERLFGSLD